MAKKPNTPSPAPRAKAGKISVPPGSVLVRHADPNASCSFGQAVDGLLVVPASAVEDLRAHGFTPDGADAEQEPEAAPEAAPDVVEPEAVVEPAAEPEAAVVEPEAAPEA
jgi:hypothetical protein